ncbi:hypothetical protein E4U27_003515 [Claviceps purpurea]|nr:hypothetical protein E4U37_001097 [Claviceps purpurea]KAG6178837.1 hypothetical protein E4U27_003515 [Claviceps purpurea]
MAEARFPERSTTRLAEKPDGSNRIWRVTTLPSSGGQATKTNFGAFRGKSPNISNTEPLDRSSQDGGLNLAILYCSSSPPSQENIRKTPHTCCAAINAFQDSCELAPPEPLIKSKARDEKDCD